MKKEIKFNSFYYGTAILWSNTPYQKEVIINELLKSKFGEWSNGGYRFVLIN